MVNKNHILDEIRRTASENGGSPLGRNRFENETGIKYSDWYSIYWVRWGDALREAGFTPNQFQLVYEEEYLLEKFISLIKELGRFPVAGEIRMKARKDNQFPSHSTFKRFGGKSKLAKRIIEFCNSREGYSDIIELCTPFSVHKPDSSENTISDDHVEMGFVYLMKSGGYYKIGRTNVVERRSRELGIQLPEKHTVVHTIKTDDPAGIESYWHKRFKDKRKNGEWFELSPKDVSDFKRRKFM